MVLYNTALRCIVLCCIVKYCIVPYCIVSYCIVSYRIALYYIVTYCIALYCIVLYCIKAIFSWLNKLSINSNKTAHLLFNPKHFNNPNCSINIDSKVISHKDSAKKPCGEIFQSDMSIDKHIPAVVNSCFLQLRDFHLIRPFITKTATIALANTFVHSFLVYCNRAI